MSTLIREYSPVIEDDEENMTLKELKELKNEIFKRLCHICKEINSMINLISELKEIHDVYLMLFQGVRIITSRLKRLIKENKKIIF